MANEANRKTTSKGRTYTHPRTKETAWSVTTIIKGGTPNEALIGWSGRSVAEYAVANYRQLAGKLEGSLRLQRDANKKIVGIIDDPSAVEAAIDWLKGAPYRFKEKRAEVGTAVHAEIEADILDKPRPHVWEGDTATYRAGWDEFVSDYHPEWLMSEATVWNRTEKYAGTLDWIGKMGNNLLTIMGDNKSGKAVYEDVALQLSAYAHGEFVLLPDGSEEPLPQIDGAVALHLRPDDSLTDDNGRHYSLIPVLLSAEVWDAFRYVREVFRWQDEIRKSVLGKPLRGPADIDWTFAQTVAEAA